DPFFKDFDLLIRQPWLVRRHGRVFCVRDRFVELAAVHVSGDHDLARAASFERGIVAGQIKVALLLVRVMAFGAIIFDQRQYVVLVSYFFLRMRSVCNRRQHARQHELDPAKHHAQWLKINSLEFSSDQNRSVNTCSSFFPSLKKLSSFASSFSVGLRAKQRWYKSSMTSSRFLPGLSIAFTTPPS